MAGDSKGVLTIGPDALRAFVELVGDLRSGLDDTQESLASARGISDGLFASLKEKDEKLHASEEAAARLRSLIENVHDRVQHVLQRMRGACRVSATRRDVDELAEITAKLLEGARS